MTRVAVFLRAINVGDRRVTNADLVAAVRATGFGEVDAYQAAGNLMLDPGGADEPQVRSQVEHAIDEAFGFTAEAYVRSAAELDEVMDAEVFPPADVEASTGKPQLAFLLEEAAADEVEPFSTDADRLVARGRHIHWLPADGVGRSALDIDALARVVGPMTVRTLGTVARLHRKL